MSLVLQMDGGNTRLKWRLLDSDLSIVEEGVELYSNLDGSEFSNRQCFAELGQVYYASVKVCESLRSILSVLEMRLGSAGVVELEHSILNGEQFAYQEFERLGIDRCLAILGAKAICEGACLVIDAGSAITADVVSREGGHLGGYIFPGVSMLRESLLGGTSKIMLKENVEHSLEPGVTTEECVSHALDLMVKSTIEFVINKSQGYGINEVILTGGDADYLSSLIDNNVKINRDLIFIGIGHVVKGFGD